MRKIILILLIALSLTPSLCKADLWVRKADFPGAARCNPAFCFSIGNKAYVGGGRDSWGVVQELWEYNPATDTWNQKSNPPFNLNVWQQGFAIGNYGYFLTDSNTLWKYDANNDSWVQQAPMPGVYRFAPCHFVVDGKAYVGGGSSYPHDSSFYCYDPSTNVWTSVADAPCTFCDATGFTANNKGYVAGLMNLFPSYFMPPLILEYSPISNSWSYKTVVPDTARSALAAFSIGNIGYFGLGLTCDSAGYNNVGYKDWWQYNAYTNSLTQKASIPCIDGKWGNGAFAVNNRGYICFGSISMPDAEVWEYIPDSVNEVVEIITHLQANLYPNPATTQLTISASDKITTISITNLLGQTIYTHDYNTPQVQVDVANLPKGIYFIKINGSEVRKFVKE